MNSEEKYIVKHNSLESKQKYKKEEKFIVRKTFENYDNTQLIQLK